MKKLAARDFEDILQVRFISSLSAKVTDFALSRSLVFYSCF